MSPGRAWLEEKLPERKILSRPRVAALLKSARALLTDLRREASHLSDELGSSNATADLPALGSCLQTPLQIWHSGHSRLMAFRHEVSEAVYCLSFGFVLNTGTVRTQHPYSICVCIIYLKRNAYLIIIYDLSGMHYKFKIMHKCCLPF